MNPSALRTATVAELETGVVTALIGKPDAMYELPAGFGVDALSLDVCRRSYAAMERLHAVRKPWDMALVASAANLTDAERRIVDSGYAAGFLATLRPYAERLLDMRRRALLRQTLIGAAEALDGEMTTTDVVGKLTARLLDLDRPDRPEVISSRDALLQTIDAVERIKTGKEKVLRTGLRPLDDVLRIRPGNLVVLAARPKVGKSTLARQIAGNVAARRMHVAWHGLEMDAPESTTLDLSRHAGINSMRFFDDADGFTQEEWDRITAAGDSLCPDETEGYLHANHYHHNLGAICRITEKLHRKHGLSLAVVDYLQLVQCDLGKGANREQVVSTISRTLKLLAMRLGVPVLALAQLSREGVKAAGAAKAPKARSMTAQPEPEAKAPAPQLHHLRESGAIEQDANAVVFLHNPYGDSTNSVMRERGPFELIVAAQRLGPTGSVQLYAEREYSRFRELRP